MTSPTSNAPGSVPSSDQEGTEPEASPPETDPGAAAPGEPDAADDGVDAGAVENDETRTTVTVHRTEFYPDDSPDDPSEAEGAGADAHSEGLRWSITTADPNNPFTSQLRFTEDGDPILYWNLDPYTLTELITALTAVRDAQVAVLTGTVPTFSPTVNPAVSPQMDPAMEPDIGHPLTATDGYPEDLEAWEEEPEYAAEPVAASWWARHRILTAMIVLISVLFLVGFITGGAQI